MLVYFPLLCLIDIESARIEGTHIPTKIPPSLSPLNQRKTENKNEIKYRLKRYLKMFNLNNKTFNTSNVS